MRDDGEGAERVKDFIEFVNEHELGKIRENVSFKQLTSLKIGGTARCLYEPNSLDNLMIAYKYLKNRQIPTYAIGNGTNLLVSDDRFDLVLIKLTKCNGFKPLSEGRFMMEAGCQSGTVGRIIAKLGYSGSAFMGVIPGTVGGLIYMNSGAYKKEVADFLYQCDYLDAKGDLVSLTEGFNFGYRESIFQSIDCLIIRGFFKFPLAPKGEEPYQTINRYLELKRNTQPLNERNAGSVFRNPPHIHAWEIIDALGYRGFSVGDAGVSMKHANFLVNKGNATFEEMAKLVELIQTDAKKYYNIDLKCEWKILKKL